MVYKKEIICGRALLFISSAKINSAKMNSCKVFLFQELGKKITPLKRKKKIRIPLSPEEKLACTLSFLATGESYTSLMCQLLKDHYMRMPTTSEERQKVIERNFVHMTIY